MIAIYITTENMSAAQHAEGDANACGRPVPRKTR